MEKIYSLLVGIGASFGLVQVARYAPRRQVIRWVNAGLWTLAGSLIGARLAYITFSYTYYVEHFSEIPLLWLGGLAWPGAVFGGVLAMLSLAVIQKVSFALTADRLAPLIPPVAIMALLGTWQIGNAYGLPVPEGTWWGIHGMVQDGSNIARVPVLLVAAGTLALYYAWLETRTLKLPGARSSLTLFGLGMVLLITSFLRGDPAPIWLGLRPDSWAALALTALSLGYAWVIFRPKLQRNLEEKKL
jgi:prolipoprotein diacylglyceryltransferase